MPLLFRLVKIFFKITLQKFGMADIGYKDAIDIREGEMMDISN